MNLSTIFPYSVIRQSCQVAIFGVVMFLQGCVAAAGGALMATTVAVGGVSIYSLYNLARDQYPTVDFDVPAPVEVVYDDSYDKTWKSLTRVLTFDLTEQILMSDSQAGILRTQSKNLNDVSWIGTALGNATFDYEYNVVVRRRDDGGTGVRVSVPFWEKKAFVAKKEKNIPEASNMMRHILYEELSTELSPVYVLRPDRPDIDIRRAPLNRLSWGAHKGTSISTTSNSDDGVTDLDGNTIVDAQEELNLLGYDAGSTDGIMGPQTIRAIKQFQTTNGIEVNGELDERTMDLLLNYKDSPE